MKEEADQEILRRLKAKQANEGMTQVLDLKYITSNGWIETRLANERLQALRAVERENERLEELKREADARKKEEILAKRNELQRLKDQKMQARKQRMIDLVSYRGT